MGCFLMAMGLGSITTAFRRKFPEKLHVEWLNLMLWGGSAMLIVDHLANSEPLLGASPAALMADLATAGIAITAACVGIWLALVWASSKLESEAEA